MAWIDELVTRLSDSSAWSYRPGGPTAVEPTALAVLALVGHGRADRASAALEELLKLQAPDGSFGIYQGEPTGAPHWTTAFAVTALVAAERELPPGDPRRDRFRASVVAADKFLLERIPSTVFDLTTDISHDTTLHCWPWVGGTHSWLEPTAMA